MLSAAFLVGTATAQTTQASSTTPSAPAPTAITDVPAGHWAREAVTLLVQKGLMTGFPDGTFRGGQNLTRNEAAMILARLVQAGTLQQPGVQRGLTDSDINTLALGVQEVMQQLVVFNNRVTDLSTDLDGTKTRLETVETTLQEVTQVGATKEDVQQLASTAATKADISNLEARLSTLEVRAAAQQEKDATPTPAVPAVPAKSGLPAPGDLPNVTFRPDPEPKFSIGGGIDSSLSSGLGYFVTVGARNVIGKFGVQAEGAFNSGSRSYGVQSNLTFPFGGPDAQLEPFLGLGGGLLISPDRTAPDSGVSDFFASGLLGLNYKFTETMHISAEADTRYYFSNKGTGTGLGAAAPSGIGLHLKLGAKLTF